MRLGIFITCLATLILACRFYSLPSSATPTDELRQESTVEQDSQPITPSGGLGSFTRQKANSFHTVAKASSVGYSPPRIEVPDSFSTSNIYLAKTSNGSASVLKPVLHGNAMNVQRLVRAQYEIPKAEAKLVMQMKPAVTFETIEIECESPSKTILQVTTDEHTQKSFSAFLSALFPPVSNDRFQEQADVRSDARVNALSPTALDGTKTQHAARSARLPNRMFVNEVGY